MAQKILILEKDPILGDALLHKLTREGFQVELEKDGSFAISKIRTLMPDLVVLQIAMPNISGYEILEAKVKDASIRNIPVIVISSSDQLVEIKRILVLGVLDYLIKPDMTADEVLKKIHMHISKQETKNNFPEDKMTGKKILWVEDDAFLSDLISKKISKYDCVMYHAKTGEEAFKVLEKETPDVIVLDILLPGLNGFEILKKIKENEKAKSIPVILLSNLDQKSDIDKGSALGAVKFLVKAMYNLDEIIAQIREVLLKK